MLRNRDVNTQFEIFIRHLNEAYCKYFPKKTKTITANRKRAPWINEETLSKIRLKSEIFKMYKNNEISKKDYNTFRNRLNKEMHLTRKIITINYSWMKKRI